MTGRPRCRPTSTRGGRARALPTNCYNGILNGLAQRADGDACQSVFEDIVFCLWSPLKPREGLL